MCWELFHVTFLHFLWPLDKTHFGQIYSYGHWKISESWWKIHLIKPNISTHSFLMFQMLFILFLIYYFYFTVTTQIRNTLQFPYNYVKNNKDLIQSFNSKLLQSWLSVNNYKMLDSDCTGVELTKSLTLTVQVLSWRRHPQVHYLSPGHCAHDGAILSCHHQPPPASGRRVYMSHPLPLGTEAHKKHQVIFHSLYIYI